MKKTVLFVDMVCPKPYDLNTLKTEAMGGTEATVVRVAEALAEAGHYVAVAQHNRDVSSTLSHANYIPVTASLLRVKRSAIVVLRNPEVALNLRKEFPSVPIWLWLHDIVDSRVLQYADMFGRLDIGVVCVSDWHKTQFVEMAKVDTGISRFPKVRRIYNPIDDDLQPNDTKVDKNKLVFFSSPHKGLHHVLEYFSIIKNNFNPEFKLYISNPGYIPSWNVAMDGVVNLGTMPHRQILSHVRESLCVFYPNHVFPETFGLVFAEANAVGTPVLTHNRGAAYEVLNGQFQLTNCLDKKATIDKLMSWYKDTRPMVRGKDEFRITSVAEAWKELLNL